MAGSYLASLLLSLLHTLPVLFAQQTLFTSNIGFLFHFSFKHWNLLISFMTADVLQSACFLRTCEQFRKFSQHSKQCKELILGKTLTPCLYLWVCEWSCNFNSRIVWNTLSSFLRFIAPEVNRDDSWAALPHVSSHLSVAVRQKKKVLQIATINLNESLTVKSCVLFLVPFFWLQDCRDPSPKISSLVSSYGLQISHPLSFFL